MGCPLSKLCVTPPFSINFRCQIENQVSDYRLLGASSFCKDLSADIEFLMCRIQFTISANSALCDLDTNVQVHTFASLVDIDYCQDSWSCVYLLLKWQVTLNCYHYVDMFIERDGIKNHDIIKYTSITKTCIKMLKIWIYIHLSLS